MKNSVIALLGIAYLGSTGVACAQNDIFIPPAQPSEQIMLQASIHIPVKKVQFIIAKDDGNMIVEANLPSAVGQTHIRLNDVPCGTTVPVRAIAWTTDGHKIKSDWYQYHTSACKAGNDFAHYNPAGPQMENDYSGL